MYTHPAPARLPLAYQPLLGAMMQLCDGEYASLGLAVLYMLLLVLILHTIVARLRSPLTAALSPSSSVSPISSPSSSAYQRAFLACTLLLSLLRALYFLLAPVLLSPRCDDPSTVPSSPLLSLLLHLPTCLLLLALSVLTLSFARIYHGLLLHGTKRQRVRLLLLSASLVLLNGLVAFTEVAQAAVDGGQPDVLQVAGYGLWVVTAVLVVMAAVVFAYGYLVFFHVQSVLQLSSIPPPASAASTPSRPSPTPGRATAAIAIRGQVAPLPRMMGEGSVESDEMEHSGSISPSGYVPPSLSTWRAVRTSDAAEAAASLAKDDRRTATDDDLDDADTSTDYLRDYPLPDLPTVPTPSTPAFTHPLSPSPSSPRPIAPAPSSLPLPPNPMRRLATLSGICSWCLLLRASLLLFVQAFFGGHFGPVTAFVYLTVCEVVPLALMVRVLGARGEEDGAAADGEYRRMG